MADVTLENVYFANPQSGGVYMKFEIKRWDEPESYYIVLTASTPVSSSGNLLYPILIPGLQDNQLYYIRQTNLCDSPLNPTIQQVNTTV